MAEDITARKDELGFAAFTSAGMDGSSDWRFKTHLANLPIYFEYQDRWHQHHRRHQGHLSGQLQEHLRPVYQQQHLRAHRCWPARPATTAANEFLAGEAVFFQNGSWEYGNLTGEGKYTDDDLAMIPIYIGVGDEANQGLCTGTENYWCVNKDAAPEEDIQATLDFIILVRHL